MMVLIAFMFHLTKSKTRKDRKNLKSNKNDYVYRFSSDIHQGRLDFAKTLGASHTILVTHESNEAELVMKIHQMMGRHPDVSCDASGAQATVRLALLVSG